MNKLITLINQFSEYTGKLIAWLSLTMVLLTFTIVVLRYGFNTGWIAMQDAVVFMHATLLMLGCAYTLKHNGHVRVDIFYRKFNKKRQAIVNLLGSTLFLMPTCVFIFLNSWDYVINSWSVLESSREAGGLPGVFLLKTLIPLTAILLLLQSISMICSAVINIKSNHN